MRALFLSFNTTALVQAANFATGILAARLLLPEGRGELALVLLWPQIVQAVASLSVDQAVSYHLARRGAADGRLLASAFALTAGVSLASIPPGLLLLDFAYRGEAPAVQALASRYFLVLTLFGATGSAAASALVALGKVGLWNLLRLLQPLLYLLGLLLVAWTAAVSVAAFAAANVAAAGLCAVAGVTLAWRSTAPPRRPTRAGLGAVTRYALKVHVGSLAQIASGRADQMAVAMLLSPRDLGLYVVAATLAGTLGLIAQTLVPLAFPRASAQAEHEGRLLVVGRYLRLGLALSAGGALVVATLAPLLLTLLFGGAYAAAAEVTRLLAPAVCLRVANGLLAHGFKALGRPGLASRLTWLAVPVSLAAVVGLGSLYGLPGVASGVLIGEAAAFCIFLIALRTARLGKPLELLTPSRADWALLRQRLGERLGRPRGTP